MTRRAYTPGYDPDEDELDDEWGEDDDVLDDDDDDDEDFADILDASAAELERRLASRVCSCGSLRHWRRALIQLEGADPDGARDVAHITAPRRRIWVLDTSCREQHRYLESHLIDPEFDLVLVDRKHLIMLDEWACQVRLEPAGTWQKDVRLDA